MRCKCGHKLLQKQGDVVRVRTRGALLLKADGCHTQCYWCKADVVIPLELAKGVEIPTERFYLGRPPEPK